MPEGVKRILTVTGLLMLEFGDDEKQLFSGEEGGRI